MQGNGGASDEDRRNGFERGGWARRAGDDETRTLITQTYQRADAFLFGRRTYELFAGSWGAIEEMRAHPIGVALNETPKYVASNTLTEPRWADTTVLSGDVAAAIGELKAKPGASTPDPSRDMQHNDSAHATAVLAASRAELALGSLTFWTPVAQRDDRWSRPSRDIRPMALQSSVRWCEPRPNRTIGARCSPRPRLDFALAGPEPQAG